MQLRIVGETKLKAPVKCPYCNQIAKPAGAIVEIIVDESNGIQYATMNCNNCKEQVITR